MLHTATTEAAARAMSTSKHTRYPYTTHYAAVLRENKSRRRSLWADNRHPSAKAKRRAQKRGRKASR
jgi:endonuclease YncB( thermonuclease family)